MQDQPGLEPDVEWRQIHFPDVRDSQIFTKAHRELANEILVAPMRAGGHEDFPVDEFPTLTGGAASRARLNSSSVQR